MTKARTYYGPWLDGIPGDAPNGSLWQGLHKTTNKTHDFVIVGSAIHHGWSELDAEWCQQFRRVYPPGSVLPEPRPLVVDGKVRDLSGCKWWMVSDTQDGKVKWSLSAFDESWVYSFKQGVLAELLVEDFCYPVQPLNGAFVPRPWPDSGCTTE